MAISGTAPRVPSGSGLRRHLHSLQATEIQIQHAIMGYLRMRGYYVQRMNSGALRDQRGHLIRMNRAGTPDIMAFDRENNMHAEGVILYFIEVKRPGKKPTPLQQAVMEELEDHGARCFVATSIEDVERELDEGR